MNAQKLTQKFLFGSLFLWPLFLPSANADELLGNWERGDLIFQERDGPEAEMLKEITGSRFTHVGILRASGGGPIVIEAMQGGGVYETEIDVFLKRGVGQKYAIYRIKGVIPPPDWYHPLVLAAVDYFNWDYDPFYRVGSSAIYNSELIYLSAKKLDIDLGKFERLGDLSENLEASRKYLLQQWKKHPDCLKRKLDKEACWHQIKDQRILTPISLIRDDNLFLIESTLDKNK